MMYHIGQTGRIVGAAAALALISGTAVFAFGNPSPEQRAALEETTAEASGEAPAPQTIWDGIFTEEQVAVGRDLYAANCASCHGAAARGSPGNPGLINNTLNRKYADQPLLNYFNYMSTNMPAGRPGTLLPQQYADVLSFILTQHGVEPGEATLTPDEALLESITIVRRPD